MNQTLSKSISILRFPLAALIVLKHYYTPDISAEAIGDVGAFQWYHYVGEFTNGIFPAIAVPLFFFISGYLYFNKLELYGKPNYDLGVWKRKTHGRLKSLLIPYLCWNLLILLLFSIVQQLTNNSTIMQKDGYKLVSDYNLLDYGKAFFAIDSTGMPIDGPLWFIRDLFIVSVFITPVIYLIIKYLKIFGMMVLSALFLLGLMPNIPGLSGMAIFYFTWGAYMSLHKMDMGVELKCLWANLAGVLMLSTLCVFTYCYFINSSFTDTAKEVYILSVVFGIFAWMGRWVKRDIIHIPIMLSTASFFIYAFHKPVQVIVRRMFFAILHPTQEWMLITGIFVIPLLVIIIALGCFYIIKRYLPSLKFLNGYRL